MRRRCCRTRRCRWCSRPGSNIIKHFCCYWLCHTYCYILFDAYFMVSLRLNKIVLDKSVAENNHHRGKDHCMVGLHFNWIGFDQTRKYFVIWIYWNYWIRTRQTGRRTRIDRISDWPNGFWLTWMYLFKHTKRTPFVKPRGFGQSEIRSIRCLPNWRPALQLYTLVMVMVKVALIFGNISYGK